MTVYKDLSGTSGVAAYEIASDSIIVQFNEGGTYLYTYASAGRQSIEHMKLLAASGRGLNTYISRDVHDLYERKLA